jgi:ankyrin repeat protein
MKLKTRYKIALLVASLAALVYSAMVWARIVEYGRGEGLAHSLREAAAADDRVAMRVLLRLGADPNVTEYFEPSAIALAAHNGNDKAVALLLDNDADPDGDVRLVGSPVDHGRIDWENTGVPYLSESDRPLFLAAARGDRQMVDLLRRRGARYEIIDAVLMADEPIVMAAMLATPQLAAYLRMDSRALLLAVRGNNVAAVKLMLELGFDPAATFEYRSAMAMAADLNRIEILGLFEAKSAKADDED